MCRRTKHRRNRNAMKKTCFHCGLDVPENLHLTVRYEGEDRETCCVGCQAVAQ
ncbi:hypothetical protein CIF69_09090, partial [Neisseria gonorrhoeae]